MGLQLKMIANIHESFYLPLHEQFKSCEEKQTVILYFVSETLNLSSAERKLQLQQFQSGKGLDSSKIGGVIMSISELPKVKDFLIEAVQTVGNRLKCNELLMKE